MFSSKSKKWQLHKNLKAIAMCACLAGISSLSWGDGKVFASFEPDHAGIELKYTNSNNTLEYKYEDNTFEKYLPGSKVNVKLTSDDTMTWKVDSSLNGESFSEDIGSNDDGDCVTIIVPERADNKLKIYGTYGSDAPVDFGPIEFTFSNPTIEDIDLEVGEVQEFNKEDFLKANNIAACSKCSIGFKDLETDEYVNVTNNGNGTWTLKGLKEGAKTVTLKVGDADSLKFDINVFSDDEYGYDKTENTPGDDKTENTPGDDKKGQTSGNSNFVATGDFGTMSMILYSSIASISSIGVLMNLKSRKK